MTRAQLLKDYRQDLRLYLEHAGHELSETTRRELLASVLALRGTLILSGESASAGSTEAEAIARLTEDDLRLGIAAPQLQSLSARLDRFVRISEENGGDVSLIDDEGAREDVEEEGRSLLAERHDIECRLTGVARALEQRRDLRRSLRPMLDEARKRLKKLDKRWQTSLAHFVPFNGYRRPYRKLYRDAKLFWWWHGLADCDLEAVYRAAEGQARVTSHMRQCGVCSDLLRKLSGAKAALRATLAMRVVHPSLEDIILLYDGEVTPEQERVIEAHVEVCPDCRGEMEALGRADEVEAEEEDEQPQEGRRASGTEEHPSMPPAWMVSAVVHTIPIPRFEGPVSRADVREPLHGLGDEIHRDSELEVRVRRENSRIRLCVYGDDLRELGSLNVVDHDTLVSYPVVTTVDETKKREFDIGGIRELADKRLNLLLEYRDRPLELPRLDFPLQGSSR